MPVMLANAGTEAATVASKATEAVTTGLTSVASDMGNMIVVVVPIALGVAAAVMVVKFGIKLFRHLSGK